MGKTKKKKRSSTSRERSRSESPDVKKRLKVIEETLRFLVKDAENKTTRDDITDSSPKAGTSALPKNSAIQDMEVVSIEQTLDTENTSPVINEAPLNSTVDENSVEVIALDEVVLEKMGDDPTDLVQKDHVFHLELTRRWNNWLRNGLKAEDKDKILKKYSRKGSCTLEAPLLNKELVKAIPESTVKRDDHFVQTQNSVGSALSALGSAISMLLSENEEEVDRLELLERLFDTGKILTEIFHNQSKARKAYISPALAAIKPLLDKATTDEFLYGTQMRENIKDDKALEKLCQLIKPSKPQQKTGPENRRSPLGAQRQVGQTTRFAPKKTIRFKYTPKDHWKSYQSQGQYQNNTRDQNAQTQRASKTLPHYRRK